MNTECLIAGVELVSPSGEYHFHGDLFQQGNTFIVNAVTDRSGDALWVDGAPELGLNNVYLRNHEYFERRGVIVFNLEDCEFSVTALEYIRKHRPNFMKEIV